MFDQLGDFNALVEDQQSGMRIYKKTVMTMGLE
jgi:hypothetical protein